MRALLTAAALGLALQLCVAGTNSVSVAQGSGSHGVTVTVSNLNRIPKTQPTRFPVPPIVCATNEPKLRLPHTVSTNFPCDGTSLVNPPDVPCAVGPSQFLSIDNWNVNTFSKATAAPDGALAAVPLPGFFGAFLCTNQCGEDVTDPRVYYDRLSQRWFVTCLEFRCVNFPTCTQFDTNRIQIAVSSGPVITSQSSFTFYQFQPGGFNDYDTLGVDAFNLYIGANVFSANQTAKVYAINKTNLMNGTLAFTAYSMPGWASPQPANNDDDPAPLWGVAALTPNSTGGGQFGWLLIPTPINGGSSTFSQFTVPSYYNPTIAGQPSASCVNLYNLCNPLDLNDARLSAMSIHTDKLTGLRSAYTSQCVRMNVLGQSSPTGDRDGIFWCQITNVYSTQPVVLQFGSVFNASPPPGCGACDSASTYQNYTFPAICHSGQGAMCITAGMVGGGYNAPIWAGLFNLGRWRPFLNNPFSFVSEPPGNTEPPAFFQAGSGMMTVGGGPQGSSRFGDYFNIVLDPNDDQTFWAIGEVAIGGSSWTTYAQKLLAPPPPGMGHAEQFFKTNVPHLDHFGTPVNNVKFNVMALGGGPHDNTNEVFFTSSEYSNHLQVFLVPTNGAPDIPTIVTSTRHDWDTFAATITFSVSTNMGTNAFKVRLINPDGQATTSSVPFGGNLLFTP